MSMAKKITLRTIANELGLSVQTVYKSLKGKPGMSEATRQLVFQAAERMGYFTKEQVSSMQAQRLNPFANNSKRFLFMHSTDPDQYSQLLLEGLRERLSTFDHRIERLAVPVKSGNLKQWLADQGVNFADGLFIAPDLGSQLEPGSLSGKETPIILLGYPRPGEKIDSVIWDMYEATFLAVEFLRSIGHRNIMYIGETTRQHRGYVLRWLAFLHAMNECRTAVDPEHHSIGERSPNWLEELGVKITLHAPTALICGIDREVPKVYQLVTDLGLRIPHDISIIGLLNEQPKSLPLFTMPLLAIRETGYRAADRMLWRIANRSLPYEHIRVQGEWFVGRTTAVPGMD